MANLLQNESQTEDFENLSSKEFDVRLGKLKTLSETEIPYKNRFVRTHRIAQARELPMDTSVKVAGRLTAKRVMGKLIFGSIYDAEGQVQIMLSKADNEAAYNRLKRLTDVGDFVGISGVMYTTQKGEITVKASDAELLSKSLRPLPEKYHGLSDTDTRYRQRYLDIISSEESRNTFITRGKIIHAVRSFMLDSGFTEVETPILQNVACGANARPFVTRHNALDTELYMRIAPELFLKEVVAAGFDRVFELGKNFRNEGMDASHLQEFSMIEWYAAYWDYRDNIDYVTRLIQHVTQTVKGSLKFKYEDTEIDFGTFAELNYVETINGVLGLDILKADAAAMQNAVTAKLGVSADEAAKLTSVTAAADFAFKKAVRPKLIQPTIVTTYPAFMVPLARRNDDDPRIIDMFQLVVNTWELVKAYSELVNPVTQRDAFEEQARFKQAGDDEAMDIDEDFVLCMEHGMPPMSGLGLGLDRFISLLTNQPTLRDVVLFPTMKKL